MTKYEALIESRDKFKKCLADIEELLASMTVEEAQEEIDEREVINERHVDD